MAFIGSDEFGNATTGATIAGTNLDNALGGSGARLWTQDVSAPWIKQVDGTVIGTNANSNARSDFGNAVVTVKMRFQFTGGLANIGIVLNATDYDDCTLCVVNTSSQVRINSLVDGVATVRDTKALTGTLTTGVWYRLTAEVDASGNYSATLTADNGDSLMSAGAATWASGAAPTLERHGFRNYVTTANRTIVDWITVETTGAPAASPSRPAALLMF